MTFVAFALPSYGGATDKLYSIDVDPTGTGNPIYGTQLRATVSNASPLQGNSQFSFVNLSVNLGWTLNPAGPVVITESGNPSPGGQPDFSVPGHLIISNLYPVKPQQSLTVTFYVNSCAGKVYGAWWPPPVRTAAATYSPWPMNLPMTVRHSSHADNLRVIRRSPCNMAPE
jgi:hypothetical protein